MKKILLMIVLFLLLVGTGCVRETHNVSLNTETEKNTPSINFTELPYEEDWLQTKLPKLSNKNISIYKKINLNIITSDLKPRSVYVLCDYESYGENSIYHHSYLAVETNSKVLFKELADNNYCGSYNDVLYACDIDGDEIDEIILQQTVGITGGAGHFLSRIFKVVNDEIKEIFNSSTANLYDTGFTSVLKNNFKLQVYNKFTGYLEIFDFSKKKQYIGIYYNEIGQIIADEVIWCDSFREFFPDDIDNDGIYEMVCVQYVSLCGHSDYVGDAKSVLRMNKNTQKFEVIAAEFIQVK